MCHRLLIRMKSWPYPSQICHRFNCSCNYLLNVFEHLQRRQLAPSGQVKQASNFMADFSAVISWGLVLSTLRFSKWWLKGRTEVLWVWWRVEAGQRWLQTKVFPVRGSFAGCRCCSCSCGVFPLHVRNWTVLQNGPSSSVRTWKGLHETVLFKCPCPHHRHQPSEVHFVLFWIQFVSKMSFAGGEWGLPHCFRETHTQAASWSSVWTGVIQSSPRWSAALEVTLPLDL